MLLCAAVAIASCEPATGPETPRAPRVDDPEFPSFEVSDPAVIAGVTAGVAVGGLAYVSFAEGELGDAEAVRISNVSAGIIDPTEYTLIGGALDPVGIGAQVGDTLQVIALLADRPVAFLRAVVPVKRAPRVIRTSPTKGRTDVALNATILVVFSEPIDSTSVRPGAVRLLRGDATVAGHLSFGAAPVLTAEFVPAEPLAPATTYVLEVTSGVRDLSGDSMQVSTTVQFRSAAVPPAPVASITIEAPATELSLGSRAQFSAVLRDAAGETLQDRPIGWSSSNTAVASVSGTGLVYGIGEGTAVISATSEWQTDTLTVTVTTIRAAVRMSMSSSGDDIPAHYTVSGLWEENPAEEGRLESVPANGSVTLDVPAGSPREVYLWGIPGHCSLAGTNPRSTGTIAPADTVQMDFAITCATRGPVEAVTTQSIAYVRGLDIYAANADGSAEVRLTNSGANQSPSWSPDGTRLAFASDRTGNYDIYVMNVDGSGLIRRTTGTAAWSLAHEPAWSPDGERIAFAGLINGNTNIAVVSAIEDGTDPVWPREDPGFNQQPSWSPGGDRIVFVSDWVAFDFVYDLYVMNADGSNRTALTDNFRMWPGTVYTLHPAWSPDGESIAFVRGTIVNESDMRFTVSVMAPDGSGVRELAWAGTIPWREVLDPGSLAWSPDGSRIAFTFANCELPGYDGCRRSVRWVSADGSQQGTVVIGGRDPSWRRVP